MTVRLCLEFVSPHELAMWFSKAKRAQLMEDKKMFVMKKEDDEEPGERFLLRELGDEVVTTVLEALGSESEEE